MSENPFSLSGKTILVTGASSGIGKRTAIECSRLGADVILSARNLERLEETRSQIAEFGKDAVVIPAELTEPQDIERLISSVPDLDGVVLCSGKGLTLPVQFASKEKFDEMFSINFFSPVELLRLLYKKKKIKKEGSVVVIASLGGTSVYSGGNSIYGASKAALNSFMKFCAKEFAARKIRVNTICPAMVETPLIHRGTVSDEQLQEDMKRYPLKRYGQPEDIAYGAVYLLSDASCWVTGHSLVIDGGLSLQ